MLLFSQQYIFAFATLATKLKDSFVTTKDFRKLFLLDAKATLVSPEHTLCPKVQFGTVH